MRREKIPPAEIIEDLDSANADNRPQHQKTNRSYGWAILLIAIGILLLLNNFSLVPWYVWRELWKFWPLFLIFWGLQIIFGRSKIANFILFLIAALFFSYFLLTTASNTNPDINNYLNQKIPIWQNIPKPPVAPNQKPQENDEDDYANPRRELDFGNEDEFEQFQLP